MMCVYGMERAWRVTSLSPHFCKCGIATVESRPSRNALLTCRLSSIQIRFYYRRSAHMRAVKCHPQGSVPWAATHCALKETERAYPE